jgi:disulfide bond formation protein DsbB
MTRNALVLLAAGGSAALLIGAYVFQAMGYAPCPLCWLQRYPHFAAVPLGLLALLTKGPTFPILGSIAASTTALLGLYHTGVERAWWLGPQNCAGDQGLGGLAGGDLLSAEAAPRVILCNQVSWEFLGISMASWNALASLALLVLWVLAARRSAPRTL